jgi:hypothetical protein
VVLTIPRLLRPLFRRRRDLLQWRVGESIPPQDRQRLEDTAVYPRAKPALAPEARYLDGQQAVLYRSHTNPSLGRNFEALDPLEWLARMSDHIPDPGQHRTILYGHYANRVRSMRQRDEAGPHEASAETPPLHDGPRERGDRRAKSRRVDRPDLVGTAARAVGCGLLGMRAPVVTESGKV